MQIGEVGDFGGGMSDDKIAKNGDFEGAGRPFEGKSG